MPDAEAFDELHQQILRELSEGRVTPSFLADQTGRSRQLVSQRLRDLIMADRARKVHKGLYEITETGRETVVRNEDTRPEVEA